MNKEILKKRVIKSNSYADVLRKYNKSLSGNSYKILKKFIRKYQIDTTHFKSGYSREKIPLDKILVKKSTYRSTSNLKNRLYDEGLKERECEMCGQGEEWNGKKMSLILDHINGINDDNELKNLRIVCPNCNATLPTHCGKNVNKNTCKRCDKLTKNDHFCSVECYSLFRKESDNKQELTIDQKKYYKKRRKVERPPYDQLIKEVEETSYSAVGRKYGVSDNAIRKWIKWYEKNNTPMV